MRMSTLKKIDLATKFLGLAVFAVGVEFILREEVMKALLFIFLGGLIALAPLMLQSKTIEG